MRVGAPGEGGFSIPVGEAERIAGLGQRLPIAIGGYWLNGERRAYARKPHGRCRPIAAARHRRPLAGWRASSGPARRWLTLTHVTVASPRCPCAAAQS